MAYNEQTNQFDYSPNNGNIFEVATSFNPDLLDLSADEAGYGSLVNRDIASDLLYYYPYKFPFDQMTQLFGGMDTTDTGVWEWPEADMLLEYSASGVDEDAADVVNNVGGYTPSATARFVIASGDEKKFAPYTEVRYQTSSGWQHAYVLSIDDAAGGNKELNLESIDGTSNLAEASATDTEVQHMTTNLPQDLDYDPNPKQSNPELYKTFTENYRKEIYMTRKMNDINSAGGTVADLISHYEDQLSENFRRDREVKTILGSGSVTRKSLSNGDTVQFSSGIYNQIKDNNLHTSDLTTSGSFDAEKFKNAMYEFMFYNYGGESAGPQIRDFYVDPVLQKYFDRAWEDKERFMSKDFVAGVSVSRLQNSFGAMDIMGVPIFSELHPIPNAQIRGGSNPMGAGFLVPMDEDHIVRVLQTGRGPSQEVFKKNGGDRNFYQRMESIEGLAIRKIQHCAVFEQVSE